MKQSGSVPVSSLSRTTRDNIQGLTRMGFTFSDMADRKAVKREYTSRRHKGEEESGYGYSYSIEGRDPDGEPVTYHRRETASPGAGQTFLTTPHGRVSVTSLLGPIFHVWRAGHSPLGPQPSLGSIITGSVNEYARRKAFLNSMTPYRSDSGTAKKAAKKYLTEIDPVEFEKVRQGSLQNLDKIAEEQWPIFSEVNKIRRGE